MSQNSTGHHGLLRGYLYFYPTQPCIRRHETRDTDSRSILLYLPSIILCQHEIERHVIHTVENPTQNSQWRFMQFITMLRKDNSFWNPNSRKFRLTNLYMWRGICTKITWFLLWTRLKVWICPQPSPTPFFSKYFYKGLENAWKLASFLTTGDLTSSVQLHRVSF
jgi:hypothetical protein